MKKILVIMFALISTKTSFAQSHNSGLVPGGGVVHELFCAPAHNDSNSMPMGISYRMYCKTAALAPQYNLVGCSLIRENTQRTHREEVLLIVEKQSKVNAILANQELNIHVKLTKSDLSADLNLHGLEFRCERAD